MMCWRLICWTHQSIFLSVLFSAMRKMKYMRITNTKMLINYYLSEKQEDILFYERPYSRVTNKFFVNNAAPERLAEEFHLDVLR